MGQELTGASFDIGQLGYDSFLEIFKYLSVKDIPSVSRVCRAWKEHAESHDLWRHFVKRDLGPIPKSPDVAWKEIYRLNIPGKGARIAHYGNSRVFSAWGRTIAIWKRSELQMASFEVSFLQTDHLAPINCMSIQGRGPRAHLLTGSQDKTIKVWQKCRETQEMMLRSTLPGHSAAVTSLTGIKDLFYSGSEDGEIRLWKKDPLSSAYHTVEMISAHAAAVTALAVDKTEGKNVLFSGSEEGEIKVWRRNNDTLIESMTVSEMHIQAITSLVYQQRQKELYSGSGEGAVRVWKINAFAMQCIFLLPLQQSPINDIFPDREGNFFLTASSQGTLKRWNRVPQLDPERDGWKEAEGPPHFENKSVLSVAAIKFEGSAPSKSILALTPSGITIDSISDRKFFRHRRTLALHSYL